MRIVPWMQPLFRDRAEAGRSLAEALRGRDGVVVGVARGGVAVAAEVARELGLPLTAVDVERVNARGRRLGAATADGPPYLLVPEEAVEDVEWDPGDALVVGSSSVGPVARVFLGSRSSKIVRHSPVPVVVVPRGAAAELAAEAEEATPARPAR